MSAYASSRSMLLTIGAFGTILCHRARLHHCADDCAPLAAAGRLVSAVAEGDLRSKVDVASKDEVGQMLTAINQMVENLRKTVASVCGLVRQCRQRQRRDEFDGATAFAGRHRAVRRRGREHLVHGRDDLQHPAECGQRPADRQDRVQGGGRRQNQRRGCRLYCSSDERSR